MFKTGFFSPIIDKVYYVEEMREAHDRMEKNENIGKIVIKWDDTKI
jgi:tumor protein p53-inducible protein 3